MKKKYWYKKRWINNNNGKWFHVIFWLLLRLSLCVFCFFPSNVIRRKCYNKKKSSGVELSDNPMFVLCWFVFFRLAHGHVFKIDWQANANSTVNKYIECEQIEYKKKTEAKRRVKRKKQWTSTMNSKIIFCCCVNWYKCPFQS